MKNLILIVAMLSAGFSSRANVVKPTNTRDSSKGTAQVQNVSFNYTVEDDGWFTSADSTKIEAQNRFVISYTSTSPVTDTLNTSASLGSDAAAKCTELGQLEYPDQVKALSPPWKASPLKADIFSSRVNNIDGKIDGIFFCLIDITASK